MGGHPPVVGLARFSYRVLPKPNDLVEDLGHHACVRPGSGRCHLADGRAAATTAGRVRWVVEATNTWWSNYGQLRGNTDRRPRHRHAALCLATAILIVGRLIDWRNRWSPR
jgi:hypothetical protein